MSGAFDWPPTLDAVQRCFADAGNRPLSAEVVAEAHLQLGSGMRLPGQPPLLELLQDWPAPTWVRLDEVAIGLPRPLLVAKLVGGLAGVTATDGLGLLINIGSNGAGDAGLSVGLPDGDGVAERWCSGLATEMIFTAGDPFGWSELSAGAYESALVATTTSGVESADEVADALPRSSSCCSASAGRRRRGVSTSRFDPCRKPRRSCCVRG